MCTSKNTSVNVCEGVCVFIYRVYFQPSIAAIDRDLEVGSVIGTNQAVGQGIINVKVVGSDGQDKSLLGLRNRLRVNLLLKHWVVVVDVFDVDSCRGSGRQWRCPCIHSDNLKCVDWVLLSVKVTNSGHNHSRCVVDFEGRARLLCPRGDKVSDLGIGPFVIILRNYGHHRDIYNKQKGQFVIHVLLRI